jgi:alpha-1,3-rhamnosyl/mannosyltransferase
MTGSTIDPIVAVNLLWCVPGEVGGSEEYLVRQLLGLAENRTHWRPQLFVLPGLIDAHPRLDELFDVTVAPFDGGSRPRRIAGETTWLRGRTRAAALRHHGGGTAPLGTTRPYMLTIHDLQYRTFPQNFTAMKRRYLDAMIGRSVRKAHATAVPSEYVRGTVIDAYGVPEARVLVVPHGLEHDLAGALTDAQELRARYALGDGPVLVYPAVTHPHKNHRFLVELMRHSWRDPSLRLVFIGGAGAAEPALRTVGDARILRLGRVPAADRNGLLAMATALVFPSTYEGFGAPLIEAMALGCPVIASDATCIPEVLGGAGLSLPLDIDAWTGALQRVQRERDDLVAAGHARAAMFTAAASGAALARAYDTAMGWAR